jgi:hypothetical protein
MTPTGRSPGRLAAALVLAAFAFLPLANWIVGGYSAPFYPLAFDEWWEASLIAGGGGLVLAMASRHRPGLWHPGAWTRLTERCDLLRPHRALGLAAAATVLYATLARAIFAGRPQLIDEIIEVWQARVYASGRLFVPSLGHPELNGAMNLVDHAGKVFGQFPAGGAAMLALGSLVHAEWLVGPVFAGIGVYAWSVTLRRSQEPAPAATNALLLLAFAPFALFMSASHMNHVTALAWILAGMAGLFTLTTSPGPRPLLACATGIAFGLVGSIRPVDALAFGAPAGLWLAWRAVRDPRRIGECLLAATGMAIPLALTLWVNAETTGHPLLFGYTILWGPGHDLGFHATPWGAPHTPLRGLELINLYLLHLQTYFLETSFPALLPALAVLAFGRTRGALDRYLAVSGALLLVLYGAYWHNGFFLGPRFVYPLLPLLALWTARFGTMLRDRFGDLGLPVRTWGYAAAIGAGLAVGVNLPIRAHEYGDRLATLRWPAGEVARAEHVTDALVFVRERWGAQQVARMWGLGLPRSSADFLYGRADMCRLEHALDDLERHHLPPAAAIATLIPLTADSARLRDTLVAADLTETLLPGATYTPDCLTRLREDARGFTVYPPLLLEDRNRNVYLRDLHALDSTALKLYPGRPLYLLRPDTSALGAPPRFTLLRRDSLMADWGLPRNWPGDR